MFRVVVAGERPERPGGEGCFFTMGGLMWTMIRRCWDEDPARRPSMVEVKENLLQMSISVRILRILRMWSSKRE
jgi:hypothetical protein